MQILFCPKKRMKRIYISNKKNAMNILDKVDIDR